MDLTWCAMEYSSTLWNWRWEWTALISTSSKVNECRPWLCSFQARWALFSSDHQRAILVCITLLKEKDNSPCRDVHSRANCLFFVSYCLVSSTLAHIYLFVISSPVGLYACRSNAQPLLVLRAVSKSSNVSVNDEIYMYPCAYYRPNSALETTTFQTEYHPKMFLIAGVAFFVVRGSRNNHIDNVILLEAKQRFYQRRIPGSFVKVIEIDKTPCTRMGGFM